MQATEIRRGTALIYQNEIFIVTDFQHRTPGNLRSFVQATMKNVRTGKIIQNRFASGENVERATLEPRQCQFLYSDEQGFHFMDMESYHTFPMNTDVIGDAKYYLKENMELRILFTDESPIVPELPKNVVLKVTEAAPGVKGDSVSNNTKSVTLETGLKVQVPLFIEQGQEVKVSTETGEYLGRA